MRGVRPSKRQLDPSHGSWGTVEYQPCEDAHHALAWIRYGRSVFPMEAACEDPYCEVKTEQAWRRAGRMIEMPQQWTRFQHGGIFWPEHNQEDLRDHEPCTELGLSVWSVETPTTKSLNQLRGKITDRADRRAERDRSIDVVYTIPTLDYVLSLGHRMEGPESQVVVDVSPSSRTYVLDFLVISPIAKEQDRAYYGVFPNTCSTNRGILRQGFLQNLILASPATGKRITTTGVRSAIPGTNHPPRGVGSSNPRLRKCPHPEHVDLVRSYLVDRPYLNRPGEVRRTEVRHKDGLAPIYTYDRDDKCMIHGLSTKSVYEVLGFVKTGQTAPKLIEETTEHEIEEETLDGYLLKETSTDMAQRLSVAKELEEYAKVLGKSRFRDDPELWLAGRRINRLRVYAALIRTPEARSR